MNRHLLSSIFYLLLFACSAPAGDLQIQVRDFTSGAITNRRVLVKLQNPGAVVAGPWAIAGDYVIQLSDTNGYAYFSNMLAADYSYTIYGSPERSGVFTMPDTNGLVNVAQLTGTNNTPTYYTTGQIDALLAALATGTNGSSNPNVVTNTQNGVSLGGAFSGTFGGPGYNAFASSSGLLTFSQATNYANTFGVDASGNVFGTSFNGALPAANLTGTVPTARLGSGTANSGTYLRGDQTYAIPAGVSVLNVKDYGAVGDGVTDDTLTVQAAIDAATNVLAHTVYFPPGHYLGNWTVHPEVKLLGAGGGNYQQFGLPTTARMADRKLIPTLLRQYNTSIPVLDIPSVFGVALEKIQVAGTNHVGIGIKLGTASGYPGSSVRLDQVVSTGFGLGVWLLGAVDVSSRSCNYMDSTTNVFFETNGSGAPADTATFDTCITGGTLSAVCFAGTTRGTVIKSGDHNLATNMCYLAGSITIDDINCEQIQKDVFVVGGGTFTVIGGRYNPSGTGDFAFMRSTSDSSTFQILNPVIDPPGWTRRKGYLPVFRTGGLIIPEIAPRGMAIEYWSDFNYTNYIGSSLTGFTHKRPDRQRNNFYVAEDWIRNQNTQPYGALGWTNSQIGAGGGLIVRSATPLYSLGMGNEEIVVGLNNTTYSGRVMLENEVFAFSQSRPWRTSFTLYLPAVTTTDCRFGLYNKAATPAWLPSSGFGFNLSRTGSDTTMYAEKILSGTQTRYALPLVTTTLLANTEYFEFVIECTPSGMWAQVWRYPYASNRVLVNEVEITSTLSSANYLAPGIFLGTSAAAWSNLIIDRWTMEVFE